MEISSIDSIIKRLEEDRKNPKVTKGITNKRQWVLSQFVDEINKERIGTRYKPVTGRFVAIKVSHLSIGTLEWFLSVCKDYKSRHGSFGRAFFGALKSK